MTTTVGRLERAAASVGALVLFVFILPAALIAASGARFGGSAPWEGIDPPWRWNAERIRSSLATSIDDGTVADVVIRLALGVAWAAIAVVVVTTAVELVHMIRHRGLAMPSVRGLGWAQGPAAFIAAGLIALLPLHGPRVSLASMMVSPVSTVIEPVTELADPPGGTHQALEETSSPSAYETRVVRRGESIYSIAAGLAGGDGTRTVEIADQILDLNLGRTMLGGTTFTNPAYIEVGWTLLLPAGHDGLPGERRLPGRTSSVHVVQAGDTLSSIAAERLGDADEWPEIWDANAGADMDGRTFDDPHLILPGWELEVPTDELGNAGAGGDREPTPDDGDIGHVDDLHGGEVDGGDSVVEVAEHVPQEPEVDGPQVTAQAAPIPPPTAASPSAATTNPTTTSPATTSPTTNPTTTTTVAGATGGPTADGSDTAASEPSAAPTSPIRVEHAAMVAAGVLALVAVRRRQRLRRSLPRTRIPPPRDDVAATERRLRIVDPGERAERIDVAVRAAAAHLMEPARIGAVVIDGDGQITVHLTAEGVLPPPWTGAGSTWKLSAATPIEVLADDARSVGVPCIAFAQLGIGRNGAEVFVDFEACGTLTITTDHETDDNIHDDTADDVVTGIAAAIATSPYAEVAHLVGVSNTPAAFFGHRGVAVASSADTALALARELTATIRDAGRSTFDLRALRTGGEVWEPAVVVLRTADVAERSDHRPPGAGIAVVQAGSNADPGGCRLGVVDGSWMLEGFGAPIECTPIGIGQADLDAVTELLNSAAEPLERASERTSALDEPTTESGEYEPPHHAIVVALLGPVAVIDGSGAPASFERSKTTELIAWLATHRERATRMGARTALWESDVRDATFANVVSEARRGLARLVAPPDGEEWVARTLSDELPLHDLVVSDGDLIEERLAAARLQPPDLAIDTLRPAVELIRGAPFEGANYLWPDAEGITSSLTLLATTATAELAAHALSVGDTDTVFWATGRGLAVLPGHEELIALRMRAHARAGDLAGVRQEWEAYERVVTADAWSDGEPAPKLVELRRELLT